MPCAPGSIGLPHEFREELCGSLAFCHRDGILYGEAFSVRQVYHGTIALHLGKGCMRIIAYDLLGLLQQVRWLGLLRVALPEPVHESH